MECRTGCLRDENCREEEPASRMELFQIVETHDQPRAAVQSGHFAIDCISLIFQDHALFGSSANCDEDRKREYERADARSAAG